MMICDDCAIAAVNDDYTGMDDETETRVRAGLERTGYLVVNLELHHSFSTSTCDCCLTTLAGGRFEVSTLTN